MKKIENCEKFIENRIKNIEEQIEKLQEEKESLPKKIEKIKEMSQEFKERNEKIISFIETLINYYTFSKKQNYNQLFNLLTYSAFSLDFEFKDYSPDEMKSLYQKSISFEKKENKNSQESKGTKYNENNKDIISNLDSNKIIIKCEIKKEAKKQFINILGSNNTINEKNCEILINGKLIDFQRQYRFEEEGEYNIELIFKNKLNDLNHLLYNCKCYTIIDLRYFNSEKVSNISYMFYLCTSLKEIKFGNFNTKDFTNMAGLFRGCTSLSFIDLSSFNTKEVLQMNEMFYECPLVSINLTNFDFSKTANISHMFYGCSSLTEIKMSDSFGEKGKTIYYFGYGLPKNGVLYCSGKRIIQNILATGLNEWEIVYNWE